MLLLLGWWFIFKVVVNFLFNSNLVYLIWFELEVLIIMLREFVKLIVLIGLYL